MNAVTRNKAEAQMLTSDAIEVHLQYLRSGLDGVQARMETTDARLGRLTDDLAEVRGYQKVLFWGISLAGTAAAALSIARTFGWI